MNRIMLSGTVHEKIEFIGEGEGMRGRIYVIEGEDNNVHEVHLYGFVAEDAKMGCMRGAHVVVCGYLAKRKSGDGYAVKAEHIEVMYGKRMAGAWSNRVQRFANYRET